MRESRAAALPWAMLVVAVLGTPGCGGTGPAAAFTVRDSAGVRIAENARVPAWEDGAAWQFSPEPLVEIGAEEDPEGGALYQVFAATLMDDGSIVLANAGTQELRVYTAEGSFLRAIGSEGDGPGRFRGLAWVGHAGGDTLVAWDWQLHRLTRFTLAGDLVGTESPRVPDAGILPRATGFLSSGEFVFNSGASVPPDRDRVVRSPVAYYRLRPGGTEPEHVGTFAGLEQRRTGGAGTVRSPLALQRVLLGRDTHVTLQRDTLYAADSERFEIRKITPDGSLVGIVRMRQRPVRVTPEDERFFRQEREARRSRAGRVPGSAPLDEPPISEVMPAFTALGVDGLGHLWVRPPRSARNPNPPWLVFAPEGRALGPVEAPDGFVPLEIGADYVLGIWQDSLGVERVRVYGLTRER